MDKNSHVKLIITWTLRMEKYFHPTPYTRCIQLSMLVTKLILYWTGTLGIVMAVLADVYMQRAVARQLEKHVSSY